MSRTEYLEKLIHWICLPTARERCCYLRTHRELLGDEFEPFFSELSALWDDDPCEQRRVHEHRTLFAEVRARGGTSQAIHEVYVNLYGGLTLVESARLYELLPTPDEFVGARLSERVRTVVTLKLCKALQYAYTMPFCPPEVIAELHYQSGYMFALAQDYLSLGTLKCAVAYYEAALQVYTRARYPMQYEKVLLARDAAASRVQPWVHTESVRKQA